MVNKSHTIRSKSRYEVFFFRNKPKVTKTSKYFSFKDSNIILYPSS